MSRRSIFRSRPCTSGRRLTRSRTSGAPWLQPGKSPHAPHQHQHEELLIIKEGTLETFQSGATRRVGPGGIIFQASNEMHNVTNVGQTPATYFVIGWTTK
ncbi:MAG: hypothetical protein AUJ01_01030 [Acidobacteria bacterium 13_1_40CM_3_65_5]|nr:MAG: hypothetical protein AUJ01_01030 [Acidobacteria bacterium 13_1_40CM_3_65_5]